MQKNSNIVTVGGVKVNKDGLKGEFKLNLSEFKKIDPNKKFSQQKAKFIKQHVYVRVPGLTKRTELYYLSPDEQKVLVVWKEGDKKGNFVFMFDENDVFLDTFTADMETVEKILKINL